MQSGTLSLTAKELDSTNQPVSAGPVKFEIAVATPTAPLTNDTLFHVKVRGGTRQPVKHPLQSPATTKRALRFYVTQAGLNAIYQQLVLVFDPTPDLRPPAVQIPTVNPALVAQKPVLFDLEQVQQLPGNVNVYAFRFTPDAASGDPAVSFQLTSTDGECIVYLVSGLIYSNPPQQSY